MNAIWGKTNVEMVPFSTKGFRTNRFSAFLEMTPSTNIIPQTLTITKGAIGIATIECMIDGANRVRQRDTRIEVRSR